jgi:hypothetical protein
LLRTIGPPMTPPNWWRSSSGLPVVGLKKPVAFMLVSRRNSQPLPWSVLVPLR